MKKLIIVLFLAISSYLGVEAKGLIVYHNGPAFSTLHKLPAQEVVDGQHVNIGVAYEQFGFFWMPIWNYGEVAYALISDDEKTAWEIDEEHLEEIREEYELDIPDTPDIPFWQKIGIKPFLILILACLVYFFILAKRKENKNSKANSETK